MNYDEDFIEQLRDDLYEEKIPVEEELKIAKYFLKILPMIAKDYIFIENFTAPIEFAIESGDNKLIKSIINKMYELNFNKGDIFKLIAHTIQNDEEDKLWKKIKAVFKNDLLLIYSVEKLLKKDIKYTPNITKYY